MKPYQQKVVRLALQNVFLEILHCCGHADALYLRLPSELLDDATLLGQRRHVQNWASRGSGVWCAVVAIQSGDVSRAMGESRMHCVAAPSERINRNLYTVLRLHCELARSEREREGEREERSTSGELDSTAVVD